MSLPIYKITIDDEYGFGEDLGIEQIAFTSTPAILVKGMAFTAQQKPETKLFFSDEAKMRIAAPALIPMNIYRNDEDEYYVQFTEQEIEAIHKKFMSKLNNTGKFNLEHNQNETVPAFILETWIVDNPQLDKSYSTFGIEVPKGSMFIIAQVTDKQYYNELISNNQVGFSIEGFLGLKLSEIKNKKEEQKMENNVLPEGAKFQIEDKWYEVKDGKVVEVVEAQKEVAAEDQPKPEETDKPVEEKMEDTPVEEKPVEEKLAEEVVVTEGVTPTEVSDATTQGYYSKEEVDAKLEEIYSMIADLKSTVDASIAEEVKEDATEVTMSAHQKFSEIIKFANK